MRMSGSRGAEGFYSLHPPTAAEKAARPPNQTWLCVLSLRSAALKTLQAQQGKEARGVGADTMKNGD